MARVRDQCCEHAYRVPDLERSVIPRLTVAEQIIGDGCCTERVRVPAEKHRVGVAAEFHDQRLDLRAFLDVLGVVDA